MPALSPLTRFCADPPGAHRFVALDLFTAIFQRRSGQTHLVDEPVPQIIRALEGRALTPAELLTTLSEGADVAAEGDPLATLVDRLAELEAIGLVARA